MNPNRIAQRNFFRVNDLNTRGISYLADTIGHPQQKRAETDTMAWLSRSYPLHSPAT